MMTAVRELAQQRVGALIAIEQATPLREYGRAGAELGAPSPPRCCRRCSRAAARCTTARSSSRRTS
jgi:hypothetical protein